MDSVLLRALDRGLVDGRELFTDLLLRNPPARVLRFLDARTSPLDDLRVMATAPSLRMARATLGATVARARRRADLVTTGR
jgi:lycopene beta-cyclase